MISAHPSGSVAAAAVVAAVSAGSSGAASSSAHADMTSISAKAANVAALSFLLLHMALGLPSIVPVHLTRTALPGYTSRRA